MSIEPESVTLPDDTEEDFYCRCAYAAKLREEARKLEQRALMWGRMGLDGAQSRREAARQRAIADKLERDEY